MIPASEKLSALRPLAAVALAAAAICAGLGCGGEGSGVRAADLGWELKPLAGIDLSKEIPAIGQGSIPYGAQVQTTLEAEQVEGVWVAEVDRDGPAAEARISPGDLITEVGGTRVIDVAGINDALGEAEAGAPVEVEGLYVASGDATNFLDAWSAELELPEK